MGFPGGLDGKQFACNAGDPSLIPGSGRSPEKGMATHSSFLAWRIPWIEEPSKLQSMGSQGQTRLSDCTELNWAFPVAQMVKSLPVIHETRVWTLGSKRSPGEGNGYPLQFSCLQNSMDRGAWQATAHGVAKSWTRLSNFHTLTRCDI